jgi:hypothetical protein
VAPFIDQAKVHWGVLTQSVYIKHTRLNSLNPFFKEINQWQNAWIKKIQFFYNQTSFIVVENKKNGATLN